jgi:hypothetical protein
MEKGGSYQILISEAPGAQWGRKWAGSATQLDWTFLIKLF